MYLILIFTVRNALLDILTLLYWFFLILNLFITTEIKGLAVIIPQYIYIYIYIYIERERETDRQID